MSATVSGLIVVLGIAAINLFFGFSLAVLLGRAPRSWSEVMEAGEFRTMALVRQLQRCRWSWPGIGRRRSVVASESVNSPTAPHAVMDGGSEYDRTSGCDDGEPADELVLHPTQPVQLFRLEPLTGGQPHEEMPYDLVLQQQLEAWRDSGVDDISASAAMLVVADPGQDLDTDIRSLVFDAVQEVITGQVRKDRRVVSPEKGRFVWFLDDVGAEDALLPTERIRHIIENTKFRHHDRKIKVTARMLVVAAQSDDDPRRLLDRLEAAYQFSRTCSAAGVVLDSGAGPGPPRSLDMEVAETERVLA
jgi:hypothetical protein